MRHTFWLLVARTITEWYLQKCIEYHNERALSNIINAEDKVYHREMLTRYSLNMLVLEEEDRKRREKQKRARIRSMKITL